MGRLPHNWYYMYNCIHSYEIIIGVFSIANLLYECYQLYTERCKYFELTNMLQVSTFVCSIITVYPMNGNLYVESCHSLNAGILGVMLSYLTMLQFVQCLFYAGIFVTMLFEVLKSLLKVFAVFFPLMFGFAMVLLLVMAGSPPFTGLGAALPKVFAMTIGEIEYSRYFVDDGHLLENLPEKSLAMVVFLIFCLLMPIALMNLLIGLAVGDIDSVQNHAELKMMATEIEAVFDFEDKIPLVLRRRFHEPKLVIFPNQSGFSKTFQRYFGWMSNISELIAIRRDPSEDGNEVIRNQVVEIRNILSLHGDRINTIMNELKQHRDLLESVVSAVQSRDIPRDDTIKEQDLDAQGILGKL